MTYSKINEKIASLKLLLEKLTERDYEGSDFGNTNFTMRLKVLHLISLNQNCTPSLIIKLLNIVKSNLAMICKSLTQEQLIVCNKLEEDRRNVFYNITEKGKNVLTEYFSNQEQKLSQCIDEKNFKNIERKIDALLGAIDKRDKSNC